MTRYERFAAELLNAANAVRECVRQVNNLRHAGHPVTQTAPSQPFDELRAHGDLVADALEQIALRLAGTP